MDKNRIVGVLVRVGYGMEKTGEAFGFELSEVIDGCESDDVYPKRDLTAHIYRGYRLILVN